MHEVKGSMDQTTKVPAFYVVERGKPLPTA
jgi:hypothetical protein